MKKLVILLTAFGLIQCGGPPPVALVTGDAAPAFTLADLDGNEFNSSKLSGQPTLLNFWATWCAPCRKEIPDLKALHAEGSVRVIGIALDEAGAPPVRSFVKRNDIQYPILIGNEDVFRRYNGYVIPHTLLLDSAGKIVKIYRGAVTRKTLEADLATI
ncbi:MAG: TlpA disulfide reductase family protein [Acidobacteriota bacterium]|nr:TlpA disulfide reductase family protein [Acidobacteriota bacterium]